MTGSRSGCCPAAPTSSIGCVRGVPVGVVTGSMRARRPTPRRARGARRLDLLLTAEDYRPGKPHPACYLLAAERLEVPPDRCVAIEDFDGRRGVGGGSRHVDRRRRGGQRRARSRGAPALDDAHVVVPTLELLTDELLRAVGDRTLSAPWWRRRIDGTVELAIRAGAKRTEVVGPLGDEAMRVAAPPVDGKANAALVRFLASQLGVPMRDVTVVRGESSRSKLVAVRVDVDPSVLVTKGGP
ncbi:MAG: DUF167 family protein [Acidimicrobiales bacterium]